MAIARVDEQGRLAVPEDALRALGVQGEGEVIVEINADGETVVLRPIEDHDDSWLLNDPEARASIERGLADIEAGRVRPATEGDLRSLAPCDP